jgi:hypothetical protein
MYFSHVSKHENGHGSGGYPAALPRKASMVVSKARC